MFQFTWTIIRHFLLQQFKKREYVLAYMLKHTYDGVFWLYWRRWFVPRQQDLKSEEGQPGCQTIIFVSQTVRNSVWHYICKVSLCAVAVQMSKVMSDGSFSSLKCCFRRPRLSNCWRMPLHPYFQQWDEQLLLTGWVIKWQR